ncbi:hypothetical protein HPB47_022547 [Ixodes persulcatus]|uniref:Uncharacterized protein n=2 Tax=Ixodes persulcatus TaxID=34615 RepID=A0AC60PZN2_IXOPE|nr:hypothetical protein HPB47_026636 [Ixodes persulcatus]KAG0430601.1 hypothetical protein HPB47_022547 [Ixodes persulcatus]
MLCGFPSTAKQRQGVSTAASPSHIADHHDSPRQEAGGTKFYCGFCSEAFTDQTRFMEHLRGHTTLQQRPFECQVCHTAFAHRVSLTNHLRTHRAERPFQCPMCLDTFKQRGNLTMHLRSHADPSAGADST